jgi:hypothetical protein
MYPSINMLMHLAVYDILIFDKTSMYILAHLIYLHSM